MVEIGRQLAALWVHVDSCTSSLLLLSYNPNDVRLFETSSAPARLKIGLGLCCTGDSPPTLWKLKLLELHTMRGSMKLNQASGKNLTT